jgi:hypothetical protein
MKLTDKTFGRPELEQLPSVDPHGTDLVPNQPGRAGLSQVDPFAGSRV